MLEISGNVPSNRRAFYALVLTGGLTAQLGLAAPPSNDNFANRIPLAGTRVTATGSNADATLEPGEPTGATVNGPPFLKTVWWTWTAPADGGLAVSAMGSDFGGVFSVYKGSSVSNLAVVRLGPAGVPVSGPQPAALPVAAGTEYQIAVGSWSGATGSIVLDLAFVSRAINDDFANRIPLGSDDARAAGSTLGATVEPGEPWASGPAHGTLWWSWTAATSGSVIFQAAAATPAPGDRVFERNIGYVSLSIFTGGSFDETTLVTNWSGWNELAPPSSRVLVQVVAGTTYQVSVGGEPGFLDQFELTVARTSPPEIILTEPLMGSEFIVGTPVPLSAEAIDPDGSVAGVEFFVRAEEIETQQAEADDTRPFRGLLTNLPPARYYVIARAADGSGIKTDSIPVELNVRPANDAFAHRIPFTGAFVTVTGMLANASTEAGESLASGQPSIWWVWTAPASGAFTLTVTAMTEFRDASLEVFTGTSLANLSPSPNLPGGSDRAVIQAEAGTSYPIAISGFVFVGTCALQVAQTEPPGVTLISPTNQMRVVEGNAVTFSAEAADPDGSVSRVEYFTETGFSLGSVSNAPFTLSRSMALGYYFVHAVATDNHGVTTRSEQARLQVVPVPPSNDAFASRIPFTGSFITVTGDTANATFETGEVDVGRDGSAWWEWTAPTTGDYTIDVASSPGYQPWLAIYTGQATDGLTLMTNSPFYSFDVSSSALVTIHALAGERYQIATGSGGMVRVGVARTLPPTVTISNPENDAVFLVGEIVEVRAEASDPDGTIDRVEIYRNSKLFATLTNEPFVLAFPLTDPRYDRFQARALDNHGIAGLSAEVRFLAREAGPANDAFSNRVPFTGSFVSVTGSAVHATLEPGEGFWVEGGSAWWEWTAPASGMFTIGVQSAAGFRPSVAVMAGTELPGLILITNRAYRGEMPGYSVQVVVEAQAGAVYPIAVAANGPVTLSVARTTPPAVILLQPAPNSVFRAGDTVVLQAEASDADGRIERVDFFLNGQIFGTRTNGPFVLPATFHEGNAGYNLRARATDDRGIATFSDNVYFEVRFRPPANDHFEDRTALQGWFITLEATDWEATREPGEPTPDHGPGSVWWRWTAPASGRAILSCDRSYAHLAACLGTNVAELSVVASTEQPASSGSQLEFDAIAGADYAIVFQSQGGFAGTFRLSLVLDARELASPRVLAPGLFAFDVHTTLERTWIIEATTNLLDWTPVTTNRWPGDTLEFLDPAVSGHPRRFYRAVGQW